MARKFWKSNDFKEIEKEWNQKLAESGFQDAEKEIGGERVLRQAADYAYRRKEHTETYREAKLEYFSILSKKIHDSRFDDASDRLIMERTAEGKTIQEISAELKELGWRKFNRDTIRYIRRRYEMRWGLRHWKPEEMVSRQIAHTQSLLILQLSFPFSTGTMSSQSGKGR